MRKTDFFINVDMVASFLFFALWFFHPETLLSYNFELKKYDDIHIHFAKVLGIALFANGLLSNYILHKNCIKTKAKILSIKLIGYIALLILMVIDNMNSKLIMDKHLSFGIFGLTLLILNAYLGLRSLKKYMQKNKNNNKNNNKINV